MATQPERELSVPAYKLVGINFEYMRLHGQKHAHPYGRLSFFVPQGPDLPMAELASQIFPGLAEIMANEALTNPPSGHRAHLRLLTNADTGIVSVLTDAGKTQEHSGNDGAIQRDVTRIALRGLATVGEVDHEARGQVEHLTEQLRELTESTDKEKEDLAAQIQRIQHEHEQELAPLTQARDQAVEQLEAVRLESQQKTDRIGELERQIEQLNHRINVVLPQEHQQRIDQLNHEHQLEMQRLAHRLEQTQLALEQAQVRVRECDGDGHADRSHASIITAQGLRLEQLEVIRRACQEGPEAHQTVIARLRDELQQARAGLLICQGDGEHESHQAQIQRLTARIHELEEAAEEEEEVNELADEDLPELDQIDAPEPIGTNWKKIGIYALSGAVIAGTVALAIFANGKKGKRLPKPLSATRVLAATTKTPLNPLSTCGKAFGYALTTIPGAVKYLGSKAINWFTDSPLPDEAIVQAFQA